MSRTAKGTTLAHGSFLTRSLVTSSLLAGSMLVAGAASLEAAPSIESEAVAIGNFDAGVIAADRRVSVFAASTQAEVSLGRTSSGRVLAAWSSRRQQGGRYGIYARWLDDHGRASGDEIQVNLHTEGHQRSPAVDAAGTHAWVAWQSHGQDGDGWAVLARRFDASTGAGGDEILVPVTTGGHQTDPVVAALPAGGAIVAWVHDDGSAPAEVRARRIAADGTPAPEELHLCGPEGAQATPALAVLEDGRWAIAFSVVDTELGLPVGTWIQRFAGPGNGAADTRLGDATLLAENGIEPTLAAHGDRWLVAWLQADGTPGHRACTASVDADGRVGTVQRIDPAPGARQSGLALATIGSRATLAWNEHRASAQADEVNVAFVALDADGAPDSAVQHATRHAAGDQALRAATGARRAVLAPDGTLLCGWSGDGGLGDGSAAHVSAAHVSTVGTTADATLAAAWSSVAPEAMAAEMVADAAATASPHEPPAFDPKASRVHGPRELLASGGEIGFTGIFDTGWTPPDPHMAVGPDHLVLMTNGAIAFLTKGGAQTFLDEIEGSFGFWGSVGASSFVFDPEAVYDPMSERFFAMASDRESATGRSYALLAVSDDADPNGLWHKYRFDTTVSGPTFDSPNLAVTDDAVIVSGDGIGGQPYPIFIYDKASLLVGAPPAISNTVFLSTSAQSAGIPPVSFDSPPAVYMLEHRESSTNNKVRLIALRDPLGTPTLDEFQLTVPEYGRPEDPPQAGTSSRPETFDARFWSVAYRNGSLWATHHVNPSRVRARWYEIATNGWPESGADPTLVQSGEIDPGPDVRTFFTAITADAAGNAALVYARSSPSEFISMETSYRAASDPLGTMRPGVIRKQNTAPYTGSRWGDYAAIDVDPVDERTMWAHHEYAQSGSWRTWVQSIAPACAASDVNCDGAVDVNDLLAVLAAWGPCGGCPEDIDGDGMVSVTDLLALLADWSA